MFKHILKQCYLRHVAQGNETVKVKKLEQGCLRKLTEGASAFTGVAYFV